MRWAIIAHMVGGGGTPFLPRLLARALEDALSVFPVVVITGARQTGKTTLVRRLDPARACLTLDDLDIRDQALSAPDDLLRRAERLTLDEVQRSPDLLLAVKRAVDRDRRPGRFLLTGSANLLLSQRIAETLAGRATYLTLWPLTQGELSGAGRAGRWTSLLSRPPREWPEVGIRLPQPAPTGWGRLEANAAHPPAGADRVPAQCPSQGHHAPQAGHTKPLGQRRCSRNCRQAASSGRRRRTPQGSWGVHARNGAVIDQIEHTPNM